MKGSFKFIDLSHPLVHGQPSFPGDPSLSIKPFATIRKNKVNTTAISLGSHQGTHLDAPFHFFDDGKTLDRMPLSRFFGPARLIDLGQLKPRTLLTLEMFQPHEGLFIPGARIIYRTGWSRQFGKPRYFTHFPDLTLEAAKWIASRKIGLLGMDTPTPGTDWLNVHKALLKKGTEIVIVESLTNLDQLPPAFTLAAFPLNFKGRDGAPCRAVAILD
jgi:arylformamidase